MGRPFQMDITILSIIIIYYSVQTLQNKMTAALTQQDEKHNF